MNAEQLTRLITQSQRLSSWLARDLAGWGTGDMTKTRRVYERAERRLARRRGKLAARLGAILERYNP